ncbi:MAG: S41 family peptidase [Anaerolineales bacterium]
MTLACQTITQGLNPLPDPTPAHPPAADMPVQLEIFEELCGIVDEEYLYEDFNGADWGATCEEYRQRVENGLSEEAFYLAMDKMIQSLGDDHSVFLSPEQVAEEEAELAGNLDYVGIGILVSAVPERGRAVILLTFPGSPAEQAGIQSHDSILAVDGEPILDEDDLMRDTLRGPEGTTVTITLQSPGEVPRDLVVSRQRISGSIPVPYRVVATSTGKRIGYILLVTFSDGTVASQVGDALKDMTREAPLDGLIIDNRLNEGGVDIMLKDTLAYFVDGAVGYFISRDDERSLKVNGEDVGGSQEMPLVVLVGLDTISYGEVFAGVLKDLDRAYLIGEATEGNVETLWGYDFQGGSRAWIAHDSFRPLNRPAQDWEQTGIIPHLTVAANWDEVTFETDPVIQAAVAYLERGDREGADLQTRTPAFVCVFVPHSGCPMLYFGSG